MFWTNYEYLCRKIDKSPNYVASQIGVKSSGTVTAWKRKNALPRQSVLLKVAEYFNVTVDELLTEDLQKKNQLTPESERELNERFTLTLDDLTSDELSKVHAFVSGLKAARKP